ncbi:unnamed protein product [Ceratitis capitata]|uniref:(Mediterranean fruit fly) hypothetical protein n=1 Tax=Ceratitis capitata TaxID=7213 RepID=A0A811UMF6_CERCA|nr:unnamed protein product [Ceratitis capitata]
MSHTYTYIPVQDRPRPSISQLGNNQKKQLKLIQIKMNFYDQFISTDRERCAAKIGGRYTENCLPFC